MPDFFDRLAARHDPAAVRLRPRLPGPFERVDSLPDAAPEAESPVAARVPAPVLREREVRRVEREVHRTDRITVLRTESPVTEPPPRPDAPPQREPAEPVTSLVPPVPVVPSPEPPRAVRGVSALHGVSRTCTKSVKVIPRCRSTMTTGSRTRFHR